MINLLDVLTQCGVYTALYVLSADPSVQGNVILFRKSLIPNLFLVGVTSGWGYLLSVLVPPASAVFVGTCLIILLCAVLVHPDIIVEGLLNSSIAVQLGLAVSPTRW